ncbi:hypothetical protein GIB67_039770 [Kingdonia uniflora]|uniref:RNase H type-1 domain-containing protein n=1 Tax=Kingdonia uniflora TaxID=39325 RepID=A0A7J7MQ00_9MAGN|nr:hypothetical protein GIB67_039770 [Kingdonia uniflora]
MDVAFLNLLNFEQSSNGITRNESSFAELFKSKPIDVESLPLPGIRGEVPSIKLPRSCYQSGLDKFKFNLIGRLDLLKLRLAEVWKMAGEVWKLKRGFCLIPLGKGYFTIQLECEEDKLHVWVGAPWIFDCQWLRLTPWAQNFSPSTQKNSCALVWIQFPGLGMEYWEEKSLMSIARTVGRPVQVDENTLKSRIRELTKMRKEEEKKNEQKEGAEGIQKKKRTNKKKNKKNKDSDKDEQVQGKEKEKVDIGSGVHQGASEAGSNLEEGVKEGVCSPTSFETWADLVDLDEEDGLSKEEELDYDKVDNGFVTPVKEVMQLLYWNYRGIGNPKSKNTLKKLVEECKPSIFPLAEPKVDAYNSNVFKLGLKEYEVDLICNENGGVPNLWISWKLGCTKPVVLSSSDQQITVWFEDVMLTFIHANCDIARRRTFWRELEIINVIKAPWLVVGDFNVILGSGGKKGGVPSSNTAILDFQNCVDALEQIQCTRKGLNFTWCNIQRGNNRILVLLDRIFMNSKWAEKFENWSYKVHPKVNSDHSTLVGKCVGIPPPTNYPFKFCKMWLGHEGFKTVVEEAWNSGNVGGPLLSLSRKLKAVKVAIREWSREVFGHFDRNIKHINAEIKVVHRDMEHDVSNDDLSEKLTVLNTSLNKAILGQEILWKKNLGGMWGTCLTIWKARNACIFDNVNWNEQTMKMRIMSVIQDAATLSAGVYWSLPELGEVKINFDGAVLGNPGKGKAGAVFRASDGEVLGAISVGLPIVTSFIAECSSIIESLEHCSSMG